MAKQEGIIQFSGAIGNLIFYKGTNGKYIVRTKPSLDKTRFETDPSFKNSRQAMSDFSTAAKDGKLIRSAIKSLVMKVADNKKLTNSMVTALVRILKTDTKNEKGFKKLMQSQISSLKGFEFNSIGTVNTTFKGNYTTHIDRKTGEMSITISEFLPSRDLFRPNEATHFQFHVAALAVNFDTGATEFSLTSTQKIEWNDTPVAKQKLETSVQPNTPNHLLLLFAVEFWLRDTSGKFYELMNRSYNAVVIADTSQA